jgi:hypothetical protein
MEDISQQIEVDGHTYLIMSKELFDLRIKLAYIDGQLYAYNKVDDIRGD